MKGAWRLEFDLGALMNHNRKEWTFTCSEHGSYKIVPGEAQAHLPDRLTGSAPMPGMRSCG